MLMLDSRSCMLVRREETQPCRAVEALESIMPRSDYICVPNNASISILPGANHHHHHHECKHSKSPGSSPAKLSPTSYRQDPEAALLQASDRDDEQKDCQNYRPTIHLKPPIHPTKPPKMPGLLGKKFPVPVGE
jgi:hypothetical protein